MVLSERRLKRKGGETRGVIHDSLALLMIQSKEVTEWEREKCPGQHIAYAGVSWRTIKGP